MENWDDGFLSTLSWQMEYIWLPRGTHLVWPIVHAKRVVNGRWDPFPFIVFLLMHFTRTFLQFLINYPCTWTTLFCYKELYAYILPLLSRTLLFNGMVVYLSHERSKFKGWWKQKYLNIVGHLCESPCVRVVQRGFILPWVWR